MTPTQAVELLRTDIKFVMAHVPMKVRDTMRLQATLDATAKVSQEAPQPAAATPGDAAKGDGE